MNLYFNVVEENENNVWTNFGSAGFPRSSTPWETGSTPWMTSTLTPAPAGPNPFEEAIARPMSTNNMVDDLVPKPKQKDLHMAEQDVGHAIPIDKVRIIIRIYSTEYEIHILAALIKMCRTFLLDNETNPLLPRHRCCADGHDE